MGGWAVVEDVIPPAVVAVEEGHGRRRILDRSIALAVEVEVADQVDLRSASPRCSAPAESRGYKR